MVTTRPSANVTACVVEKAASTSSSLAVNAVWLTGLSNAGTELIAEVNVAISSVLKIPFQSLSAANAPSFFALSWALAVSG